MRNYKEAKSLFKDALDTRYYFDSIGAQQSKNKIIETIKEKDTSLIFILGDPGVGKSFILSLIYSELKDKYPIKYIDHPFFEKKEFLKMLYEVMGIEFDQNADINSLKENLANLKNDQFYTILLDEAQLLNDEQLEFIRILSDTNIFQFIISMHKEEGETILKKKHFKTRVKKVIEIPTLKRFEIERYIHTTLMNYGYADIALLFDKKLIKLIEKYTNGNFRALKNLLYSLFTLLDFAKENVLQNYTKPNSCLITMSALDIGLIDG